MLTAFTTSRVSTPAVPLALLHFLRMRHDFDRADGVCSFYFSQSDGLEWLCQVLDSQVRATAVRHVPPPRALVDPTTPQGLANLFKLNDLLFDHVHALHRPLSLLLFPLYFVGQLDALLSIHAILQHLYLLFDELASFVRLTRPFV